MLSTSYFRSLDSAIICPAALGLCIATTILNLLHVLSLFYLLMYVCRCTYIHTHVCMHLFWFRSLMWWCSGDIPDTAQKLLLSVLGRPYICIGARNLNQIGRMRGKHLNLMLSLCSVFWLFKIFLYRYSVYTLYSWLKIIQTFIFIKMLGLFFEILKCCENMLNIKHFSNQVIWFRL